MFVAGDVQRTENGTESIELSSIQCDCHLSWYLGATHRANSYSLNFLCYANLSQSTQPKSSGYYLQRFMRQRLTGMFELMVGHRVNTIPEGIALTRQLDYCEFQDPSRLLGT